MLAAEVKLAEGNIASATRLLSELVAEHPFYSEARWLYIDLLREQENDTQLLAQAKLLVKHSPGDVDALGCLAQISEMCGDTDTAKNAYKETIHLDPGFSEASFFYFRILLRTNDIDQAKQVLKTMQGFRSAESQVLAAQVMLSLYTNRISSAAADLKRLAIVETNGEVIEDVATTYCERDQGGALAELLFTIAEEDNVTPDFAAFSIVFLASNELLSQAAALLEVFESNKSAWIQASKVFIRMSLEYDPKSSRESIRWFSSRFPEASADTELAMTIAWAHCNLENYTQVIEIMPDWKNNPSYDDSDLLSLSMAMLGLDRREEAYEVSQLAHSRCNTNSVQIDYHKVILAHHAVELGDINKANEILELINPSNLNSNANCLYMLAKAQTLPYDSPASIALVESSRAGILGSSSGFRSVLRGFYKRTTGRYVSWWEVFYADVHLGLASSAIGVTFLVVLRFSLLGL